MTILFDIGASKMRVATYTGMALKKVSIMETPQNFTEGVSLLARRAQEIAGGKKITLLCGGIASSLDRKKETLFNAPNLPYWRGENIARALRKATGAKNIILENDTALVGLGEAIRGAGKKKSIVVYVTVSTGVNGVRIVDGAIDRSVAGFEIGHQIIGGDAEKTLEYYAGAASLAHRYGVAHAQDIRDPEAWRDAEQKIAMGINNTILHWSPDIVVLGGGSIVNGNVAVEKISQHLKNLHTAFPALPPIKKSSLGDLGGLYGALARATQKKK